MTLSLIAHRGASADAPENTLAAFALAWAQGADGIEGDFQLTADGEVVCIHDADTARVTGEKLIVREHTLAALRRLDAGAWRGSQYRGEKIPTLAEVLAAAPRGKTIQIEIKCGSEIIPPLLAGIKRSGLAAEQITVICFDAGVIADFKAQAPHLAALWLVLCRRDDSGAWTPPPEWAHKKLTQCGADGIGAGADADGAAALMRHPLLRHYRWGAWTVDDPAAARRLRDSGAFFITTNTPARLRSALAAQDERPA